MPRSAMPCTCSISSWTWVASCLQRRQIGTDDLDRIGAFDAGNRLLDVVLDVLREVEVDAGQFVGEFFLQLVRSAFPWSCPRAIRRTASSGTNNSTLENGDGVAAVVRPAMLRHHGDDFRMAQQDLAHLAGRRGAGVQGHRRRHRGADPVVALLERGQELAAEPRRSRPPTARNSTPMPTMICAVASDQRSTGV